MLQIYECRRWSDQGSEFESWAGALIIAAESEAQAAAIFQKYDSREGPEQIVVWPSVTADGEPRVLYDDDMR